MVYNYSRLLYRDRADCQEERPAEAFMSDSLVLLVNWGSNPFSGAILTIWASLWAILGKET